MPSYFILLLSIYLLEFGEHQLHLETPSGQAEGLHSFSRKESWEWTL